MKYIKYINNQYWKIRYNLALFEYKRFRGLVSIHFTTYKSLNTFFNIDEHVDDSISIYKEMYYALTAKLGEPVSASEIV